MQVVRVNLFSASFIIFVIFATQPAGITSTTPNADNDDEIIIDDDIPLKMQLPRKNNPYSLDLDYDLSDYDENDKLEGNADTTAEHEWDVLVFTQQWPVTTCYHWREENKTHECKLPDKKEFWTIHGIWPTKMGHFGPNFCNKSADFDVEQLERILANLEQFWPDLEGESDENNYLWKHEWLKHGTCAATLEQLNNELKYFGQGLHWRNNYLISKMLDAADIHPDSNNTVITLNNALVKSLGKNPSIHCLYDQKKDISYLAEIRICFNKTLELIDCDGVNLGDVVSIRHPGGRVNTNCRISNTVHYPSLVPPLQREKERRQWKFPLVEVYKLLQFIMWFTL